MSPSPSPPVLPSYPAVPSPVTSSERVSGSEPDPSLSSPIQSQPPDREMSPPELVHKPGHIQGLHSLTFNQDFTWFAAATDLGFRIYEVNPFRETLRINFSSSSASDPATAKDEFNGGGGIGQVHLLFRSSILALVGGGDQPQYPPTKLMIWDNHQSNCIANLSFRSDVKAVRLRRDRIFVVLTQKLYVYNFADLKLVHQIETIANPKGLCEVSCKDSIVLVCPGIQKGQIRVENYSSKRTTFIMAHGSNIAAMALTQDGMMVATASSKGTLIRVFDTRDGTMLQEVRRGKDRAEIYSIAFSTNTKWLGVTSDHGTIHVFGLKHDSGLPQKKGLAVASETTHFPNSPRSPVSLLKGVLPKYFSSEWSVAQFRLLEGCQYIVAFGQEENTVVIVGMDGSFYRCKFDPVVGGDMTQLENCNFLQLPEDPQS